MQAMSRVAEAQQPKHIGVLMSFAEQTSFDLDECLGLAKCRHIEVGQDVAEIHLRRAPIQRSANQRSGA